jgi:hypothetical protein
MHVCRRHTGDVTLRHGGRRDERIGELEAAVAAKDAQRIPLPHDLVAS